MKRFKFSLLSGIIAAVLVFAGIGALALVARAQDGSGGTPTVQTPGQATSQEANEATETNETAETGQSAEANEPAEANESANLQGQAAITQADAEAAALAANPGAKVIKTELDNESGALAYTVELDNGADVMVDANTGAILSSQQDKEGNEAAEDAESADNDNDQTQEEHQSQADDANETPGVEDAAGK